MSSKKSSRSWFKPVAIIAVLAALAVGGGLSLTQQQAAPAVSYTGLDGKKISTAELRGKVVMVNFWATSCATCVKEMPQMVETYNKFHAQGLEFIAVAMQYDPPNYVLNFAEQRQLPFIVSLDTTGALAQAFGDVSLTPTTFLIDKQGKIIKRYVGEPDFQALHVLLQQALAAPG